MLSLNAYSKCKAYLKICFLLTFWIDYLFECLALSSITFASFIRERMAILFFNRSVKALFDPSTSPALAWLLLAGAQSRQGQGPLLSV